MLVPSARRWRISRPQSAGMVSVTARRVPARPFQRSCPNGCVADLSIMTGRQRARLPVGSPLTAEAAGWRGARPGRWSGFLEVFRITDGPRGTCLLYTSDAADEE